MHGTTRWRRWLTATLAMCLFAAVTTIPSAVAEEGGFRVPDEYLEHLSESVNVQYYVQHPTQAPKQLAHGLAKLGGCDVERAFAEFDSGTALEAAGDLVHTGPTGTNVGDVLIGLKHTATSLRGLVPPRML